MAFDEKRNSKRLEHSVPLQIGVLNMENSIDALTLNCCSEGMCFKSNAPFRPGTGLLIRVFDWKWNASSPEIYECLRTITIAEVKWSIERPDETHTSYEVGVKYYPKFY